ncbi:MAG: hypothetical protein WDN30_15260 [Pararobbsia sp.]
MTYIDPEGNEVEQPAEMVILAAFQLHNVHLMPALRQWQAVQSRYERRRGSAAISATNCSTA